MIFFQSDSSRNSYISKVSYVGEEETEYDNHDEPFRACGDQMSCIPLQVVSHDGPHVGIT